MCAIVYIGLIVWFLKRLGQIQELGRCKHYRLSIKAHTLTYTWPKLYQIHSTIKNKSICRQKFAQSVYRLEPKKLNSMKSPWLMEVKGLNDAETMY